MAQSVCSCISDSQKEGYEGHRSNLIAKVPSSVFFKQVIHLENKLCMLPQDRQSILCGEEWHHAHETAESTDAASGTTLYVLSFKRLTSLSVYSH